mgnify:CR=1 FL=1
MALKIIDTCINCGVCEPECPNKSIYGAGTEWELFDKTHAPLSNDFYYIVPEKCTECVGFHDEPQCVAVCPVDACVLDEKYPETKDQLLAGGPVLEVHKTPEIVNVESSQHLT